MRKAKVEEYKLTRDQKVWRAAYKRVHNVERGLRARLDAGMSELRRLQELYDEAAGKKKELLQMAPLDQMNDLPGQDLEEQESEYSRNV